MENKQEIELTFELGLKTVGEKEYRAWLESFMPDQPRSIDLMIEKLKKVKAHEKHYTISSICTSNEPDPRDVYEYAFFPFSTGYDIKYKRHKWSKWQEFFCCNRRDVEEWARKRNMVIVKRGQKILYEEE